MSLDKRRCLEQSVPDQCPIVACFVMVSGGDVLRGHQAITLRTARTCALGGEASSCRTAARSPSLAVHVSEKLDERLNDVIRVDRHASVIKHRPYGLDAGPGRTRKVVRRFDDLLRFTRCVLSAS